MKLGRLRNYHKEWVALVSKFYVYLQWINAYPAKCLHSVLNVKTLVGIFNQKKVLCSRGLRRDCKIFANLPLTFV